MSIDLDNKCDASLCADFIEDSNLASDLSLMDDISFSDRANLDGKYKEARIVEQEWFNDLPTYIEIRDNDNSPQRIILPSLFKPTGIVTRDLDKDGDLDIIVYGGRESSGGEFEHGILVYHNITTLNQFERASIELKFGEIISDCFGEKTDLNENDLLLIKSYYKHFGHKKFVNAIFEAFSRVNSYFNFSNFFGKILNCLSDSEREDVFKALISKSLEADDSIHAQLFFGSFMMVDEKKGAEIIKEISVEDLSKKIVTYSKSGPYVDMSHFHNALVYLEKNVPELAASISKKLNFNKFGGYDYFPPFDKEGFLEWVKRVPKERVIRYVEFLVQNNPEIAKRLFTEVDKSYWLDLGLKGLSVKVINAAGIEKDLERLVIKKLQENRTNDLKELDDDWVLAFIRPGKLKGELLGRLLVAKFDNSQRLFSAILNSHDDELIAESVRSVYAIDPSYAERFITSAFHEISSYGSVLFENDFDYGLKKEVAPQDIDQKSLYDGIASLPAEIVAAVLDVNPDYYADIREFALKSSLVSQLEYNDPKKFHDVMGFMNGPFIGNGLSQDEAVKRLINFINANKYGGISILIKILNSTRFSKDYLESLVKKMPAKVRKELAEDPQLRNYSILKLLGKEPLRSDPALVYQYLIEHGYDPDESVREQILTDMALLNDSDFLRVVKIFMARGEGNQMFKDINEVLYGGLIDSTGIGWIHQYLKKTGNQHKLELLKANSGNYLSMVDALRRYGVDVDLYIKGDFKEPLTEDEIKAVADQLRGLPPEKLDSIKGILVVDSLSLFVAGTYDYFGNITLSRNKNYFSQGLRIKDVPFMKELVTHEGWHGDEGDLTRDQFSLFTRCSGYQRTDLYSRSYELVEGRKFISTYHTNVFEDFAEAGTNYELNGKAFRQKALQILDDGDPYLALQYLFFKHVPAETKGKEYPIGEIIPATEEISVHGVRERLFTLEMKGVITHEKAAWIKARLDEIEQACTL